jgi:tetratricopeptide (TPR) repeat protein
MNMRDIKQSRLSLLNKIEDCCLSSNLLVFCAARLSNKIGDNQRTLKILGQVKPSNNKINFYYLDYLYAMSKLYQLNFEEAENSFLRFLNNFKGNNYIKSAYHKLSIISFLTDSLEKRGFYQNKTLEMGQSFIEEDKYAENQVKKRNIGDKDLIMARLLFDGGYYQRSLNILESVNQSFLIDYNLTEYYYRIARLYQKLNYSKNDILDAFYALLDLDNTYNLYYFPMSNLQIALEYEKEENHEAAIIYFQKTLKYNSFDYETGIKKSAKAGLNRIQND